MAICPICNALQEIKQSCPTCQYALKDAGKVSDYSDPYGHYNDEETVKMGDGFPNTAKDEICPHLLRCDNCTHEQIVFIKER